MVDEVDAMLRTKNGSQKFEQALKQMHGLGPSLVSNHAESMS